jgi:glucose-6-phosphate 1-dehydrogenase
MAAANPFLDPLRFDRRLEPCAMLLLGANGDLTRRKLTIYLVSPTRLAQ